MANGQRATYLGDTPMQMQTAPVTGDTIELFGETYYCIHNYDQMPPFFMSVVSSSDHWLFISSTGGLTAGRQDAESALFPYETDDKVAANHERTGPKTIIRATRGGRTQLWEPFSDRDAGLYRRTRNLYKNVAGNKLIFEEVNHDLQLSYRYAWRTSDRFGFVKSSWLHNRGEERCEIELIDGLQNLVPYGVTEQLQTTSSNLLNAYKRNELEPVTGLGIFTLSATLTDRAEPSESLKATVAWQLGLEPVQHLLSATQLPAFRRGLPVSPERDVLGKPGAYLINGSLTLAADETRHWHIVAEVNQDRRDVTRLLGMLASDGAALEAVIEGDIARGTDELIKYVAAADGLQHTADQPVGAHHFANILFNIMRGGIFADGYWVEKRDFAAFVQTRNRWMLAAHADWFDALPDRLDIRSLYARASQTDSLDLIRLAYEYLPLMFSRRHGDPSRPWNRFAINLRNPDGSPRLDYQGNWRDIFQNWEPLALSFPAYIEGMIAKFLNATTADGYNPYRVTRDGIEWEVPEPDNPWSNIGYWNDHQIIYLQKLLEIADQIDPVSLPGLWNRAIFAQADVPYRLRPYREMLTDWYNTIDFDIEHEQAVEAAVAALGTDGRLRRGPDGAVIHVTMVEKLLTLLLAKLTNLVPEGGIWMNTQRPEWNDANNALVGKGLSVVTAAYLYRFIAFWQAQLAKSDVEIFEVSTAVATLFAEVQKILVANEAHLDHGFSASARREIMDGMGEVASAYRAVIYQPDQPGIQTELSAQTLRNFLALAQAYIEQTLRTNRRDDGLYHAYNVLRLDEQGAHVDHLYTMLEGQVAILSSGLLTPAAALTLLQSLRHSDLYRADQHTYMLYPNRALPGFLQKNNVHADQVADSPLVAALTTTGDLRLLVRDEAGVYHFNGTFRNAGDVEQALISLAAESDYYELVAAEQDFILDLFEQTFDHRAFTGRSGTFFAYEGLGSIYWHMVAKLLLAVQECYFEAVNSDADPETIAELAAAYYDVREGIGFNKPPADYGAFPTDPYSHTPMGGGARQPGMTGQVKEEILTRFGELGVSISQGRINFAPTLLRPEEFLTASAPFAYVDIDGAPQSLSLPAGSLAFTFCQTPVIYTLGEEASIELIITDGRAMSSAGTQLDLDASQHIMARNGQIRLVRVAVDKRRLNTGVKLPSK